MSISNASVKNLKDAQQAYHALLTGRMARVVVDQNGERVEFTSTNQSKLAAYIAELQLAAGCVDAATQLSNRYPATFTF